MRKIFIVTFTSLLFSCAIPHSHETEHTIGRKYEGKQHTEASTGKSAGKTAFMIDGALVLIPFGSSTKATYLYAIKTNEEKIITTQSSRKFKDGKCVKLHHPKLVWDEDSEFNFVAGTLNGSSGCN